MDIFLLKSSKSCLLLFSLFYSDTTTISYDRNVNERGQIVDSSEAPTHSSGSATPIIIIATLLISGIIFVVVGLLAIMAYMIYRKKIKISDLESGETNTSSTIDSVTCSNKKLR